VAVAVYTHAGCTHTQDVHTRWMYTRKTYTRWMYTHTHTQDGHTLDVHTHMQDVHAGCTHAGCVHTHTQDVHYTLPATIQAQPVLGVRSSWVLLRPVTKPSSFPQHKAQLYCLQVPEQMRDAFLDAVETSHIRTMQNKQLPAKPLHQPGEKGGEHAHV
jgi:hypothetical protein